MSESAPRSRAELLAAYRATSYEVIGADERIGARIGRQAPRVDELLRRHGAQSGTFITAWNPRSSPQPEEANAQAHARLAAHLDAAGRRQLPHEGASLEGDWREAGFFVLDLSSDEALALAEAFEQNAVVRVAVGEPAVLLLTRLMPDA